MLTIPDFFDSDTSAQIVTELRNASADDATVSGHANAVDLYVRRTRRITPPAATRALVLHKLGERKAELDAHFEVATDEIEEPQFLRYGEGDFFVAHQDGNTPMVYDHTRFRKISVVIFLSERSAYDGGELRLHGRYPDFERRETAPADRGTLVAFPAETTHEVTPLVRGERFTIVSWYRVRS